MQAKKSVLLAHAATKKHTERTDPLTSGRQTTIQTTQTVKLIEVYNYKDSVNDSPFLDLATFALSLLTIPYSNAEVERLFSVMNIIKTKKRNKLATELH